LIERIEGAQAGKEWVLEPELIIRRSCGYLISGYSEQSRQTRKAEP